MNLKDAAAARGVNQNHGRPCESKQALWMGTCDEPAETWCSDHTSQSVGDRSGCITECRPLQQAKCMSHASRFALMSTPTLERIDVMLLAIMRACMRWREERALVADRRTLSLLSAGHTAGFGSGADRCPLTSACVIYLCVRTD